MSIPKLSVALPCYNESKNIPLILKKFLEVKDNVPLELILVNNGSVDNTEQVLKGELKNKKYNFAKYVNVEKNIGYGYGIFTGLKAASGEVLSYSHADLQTDPNDVIRAFKLWLKIPNRNNILIKGKRTIREPIDLFFTTSFHLFADFLFLRKFNDINGQPKIFHRDLLNSFKNPPLDFNFDFYVQYKALRRGMEVKSIPVNFSKRIHGHSHWNINFKSRMRIISNYLAYLLRLRFLGEDG